MGSIPVLWSCFLLFALLASGFVQQGESVTVEVIAHFAGNTTLPDPGPINTFLRFNTNLSNPFLPKTPLQLQRCKASMYSMPVDFYTLQHPSGCEQAPGLIRIRKETKRKAEDAIWISAVAALGVTFFWTLLRICSPAFNGVVGYLPLLPAKLQLDRNRCHDFYVVLWFVLPFGTALYAPVLLYLLSIAPVSTYPAPLPNPININQFLTNQNLTLYRCNIRDLFQVYIGFADSCDQVQWTFYPETVRPTVVPLAHKGGMTALLTIASMIAWAAWLYTAMGLLSQGFFIPYWDCFYRRKVHHVEMQPPAGSGVV